jgi:hypothetical protein
MAETANCKKAQLAALAETEIRGTGWLPVPVRVSESEETGDLIREAEGNASENLGNDN